jgi:hypothetical protein
MIGVFPAVDGLVADEIRAARSALADLRLRIDERCRIILTET